MNMRMAYVLLILTILLICVWFNYVSMKTKEYYRTAFRMLMWAGVLMYVNRFLAIAMEEGFIAKSLSLFVFERTGHYIMTVSVYALYDYFMVCLLDQFHYYRMRQKVMLFAPAIIIDIFIFTSPWTGLVFYIDENGMLCRGVLFWIMMLVKVVYGVYGTARGLQKRRLLPKIFGDAIIVMAVFAIIQMFIYIFTFDETLYYSMLIVNLILFQLAITVVDFYKDSTTGLLNREAFKQYRDKEICKKNNRVVYLIKLKNYGYLQSNYTQNLVKEIIKNLAERIKEYTMLSSLYYIGGGRFVIIVSKKDKFEEEIFLKELKKSMESPFSLNGVDMHLSLFMAILNLESGKINKNNFRKYFTACDDMRYRNSDILEIIHGDNFGIDQLQRYHDVEEAIERALVEKEFKMFYQPIISTKTGKIVSAEALIRLNDRELGFISPEEFIPISENNGKIMDISEFVIDTVFRFVKEHSMEELGLEFIELNLSVMQCMDKNLTKKLEYYIEKYDIDTNKINLEITETATNFDEERLKEQLIRIKKLGFSFSLDDYGTGYSNLVRVLEYPVDIIKLDKSIVWSAFHDRDNYVTLKNLISMFHDVRRKLVAEGVENEEQMLALKDLDCDYLQGYYYSRPVDEETFIKYVKSYTNSNG